MTTVTKKDIPNGSVPNHGIKDQAVRDAVCRLNENIVSLASQLSILQSAVMELQRKKA